MKNLFTDEELPYVLLMLNEGQAKINTSKAFVGYQNVKIQEEIIEKVRGITTKNVIDPNKGYHSGMDIRTTLAKDAMNGILAGRNTMLLSMNEMNEIVENAIILADKLIEALNE